MSDQQIAKLLDDAVNLSKTAIEMAKAAASVAEESSKLLGRITLASGLIASLGRKQSQA